MACPPERPPHRAVHVSETGPPIRVEPRVRPRKLSKEKNDPFSLETLIIGSFFLSRISPSLSRLAHGFDILYVQNTYARSHVALEVETLYHTTVQCLCL